jgi:hypothetical protein
VGLGHFRPGPYQPLLYHRFYTSLRLRCNVALTEYLNLAPAFPVKELKEAVGGTSNNLLAIQSSSVETLGSLWSSNPIRRFQRISAGRGSLDLQRCSQIESGDPSIIIGFYQRWKDFRVSRYYSFDPWELGPHAVRRSSFSASFPATEHE